MEITGHEPAKPGFWWVTVGRNSRSNNPLISLTQIWYIRRMKNDFLDLAVGMETEEAISLGRSKNIWRKFSLDTRPAARNHSSTVYDSASSRIVLFGGHDGEKIFGDLWIFENGKWYKEFEHPPVKRINNGH